MARAAVVVGRKHVETLMKKIGVGTRYKKDKREVEKRIKQGMY